MLAAWIVASSLERIKLAGDKITVKGYAEEKVVSDAGTWRAIVSVRAPDLPTAYGKLEADSARVREFVESVAGADVAKLQHGHRQHADAVRVRPGRRADRAHPRATNSAAASSYSSADVRRSAPSRRAHHA